MEISTLNIEDTERREKTKGLFAEGAEIEVGKEESKRGEGRGRPGSHDGFSRRPLRNFESLVNVVR